MSDNEAKKPRKTLPRDERHRFLPDPNPSANAVKQRAYKQGFQKRIRVETLAGMAPSPFDPRSGITTRERHAQTDRAIARARGAIDLIFDFTENLIRAGDEVVAKIRAGREVNEAESRVIVEARQAANKLLDKTVPDIITEGSKGGLVQINFGAPLARLMQPSPATIEIEQEHPSGPEPDQLHAAPVGTEDPR